MATPAYQGPGQPAPDIGVGWLGRLGSILGSGTTPPYFGDGQPSSSVGGSRVTPAYMPAPQKQDEGAVAQTCPIDPAALASGHIAIVIPRSALCTNEGQMCIDPAALASGHIAIAIPRNAACDREEQPATD